ncbi:MAG: hypothetical protein JWO38_1941 [Gemmataceae bacterium]|nr:hypothetical protein [Gemmataceae bacterium]
MQRLLTRMALGLHIAAFAVACVVASPLILFRFGVFAVRDWIEERWPDSERARSVSFWFGLLAPVAFLVVLAIVLGFVIAKVRELKQTEPAAAPDPAHGSASGNS